MGLGTSTSGPGTSISGGGAVGWPGSVCGTGCSGGGIVGATPAPSPANDDPSNWGQAPGSADPTAAGAYPIGGFTFMLTYTCYNNADGFDNGAATRLRNFFHAYFKTDVTTIAKILKLDGFAPLPTAWQNAINTMMFTQASTKLADRGQAGTACAAISPGA